MLIGTVSYGGLISMIGSAGETDYNGTGQFAFTRNNGTNGTVVTINSGNATESISLATQYRMGFVYDDSGSQNLTPYLNNVAGTPLSRIYTNTTTMQVAIGNRISSGAVSGGAWEGPVSEIDIMNAALNSTQLNNLDTYFTCQWGS